MIETVRPWIEQGRLRIVCADSIDEETWSKSDGDPRARIELQERWFHYIIDELLPQHLGPDEKAMATGCSMGGVHAGNCFFRRPDRFDTLISLSGLFNANYFFHGYMDDLVYANSPIHFLPNMPEDHPWMKLYRQSDIIFCVGQGAWEDEMLRDAHELDGILNAKEVPHWADFWGYDVNHDWDWWRKQLPYFMGHLLGPA
jgi:esterase/lipase superfamily enzyme